MSQPDTTAPLPVYQPPKTISVSALRDYHRCGHYYRLRRVDKLPVEDTHHMAAGSMVHDCFYAAYGMPVEIIHGRFAKARWEIYPDAGFRPERALQLFDALWFDQELTIGADTETQDAHALLKEVLDVPTNFATGPKKALKSSSQKVLRRGWHEHYREMLEKSLAAPFEHPVIEIERKVEYRIGSHPAVGYIDLVLLDLEDQREIYVDLKSGYRAPNGVDLFFDEQMNCYYTTGPKDIWYFHLRTQALLPVDNNLALNEWFSGVADETIRAIHAGYFPKRFSPDCVRCVYRTQCIGI